MAEQPLRIKTADVEAALSDLARLELRALQVGVEYVQVWLTQAARLSVIAAETLSQMQDQKASLQGTARRLNQFGRQNAEAFSSFSSRFNQLYFDELARFADAWSARNNGASSAAKAAQQRSSAKTRAAAASRARGSRA